MMEAAGFAVSVVQLVAVVKICWVFIHDFTTSQQKQEDVHLKLFFERHFFESQCNNVSLPQSVWLDNPVTAERSSLDATKMLSERLNVSLQLSNPFLVEAILQLLETMKRKFELAEAHLTSPTTRHNSKSRTQSLSKRMKGKFGRQHTDQNFNSRASLSRSTRWALLDKKAVLQLLADWWECSENLRRCMPQSYQEHVKRQANLQIISESGLHELQLERELGAIEEKSEEIDRLAMIKEMQLNESRADPEIQEEKTNGESCDKPTRTPIKTNSPVKFYLEDFGSGSLDIHPLRQVAKIQPDLKPVLVEWKYFDPTLSTEMVRVLETRVESLASMLQACKASVEF